jgi:predicted nucleic acid-binding protein
MIVVDTNVLASRNLTSVPRQQAEQVEKIDPLWIVPTLWRYEFQNILVKAVWAKQITSQAASDTWSRLRSSMADNEHDPPGQRVIELSERHRITAYDANFIALAMELDTVCVTEDGELQEKFPLVAVGMSDFIDRHGGRNVRESRTPYRTRPAGRKQSRE